MGNLNNLQEIQTFKEFLEDKTTSDEIYFYLNCRFLLCNGPMLANQSSLFTVNRLIIVNKLHKL